jgi:hypothetical protein
MSDKPFDAEACDIGGQASATNGLSDMKTPFKTHRVIDPLQGARNANAIQSDLSRIYLQLCGGGKRQKSGTYI